MNGILGLSEILLGSGLAADQKECFDIRQILSLVMNSHSPNAINKGLNIECFIHPQISGELQGDSGRLTQILNNIVSNAIKYTDKGGITIEVMPDDCMEDPYPAGSIRLLFVVSDTG
ncbi:hybrid sensor histidine kinase/response regulator, partial [Aduncisulcus paluster]